MKRFISVKLLKLLTLFECWLLSCYSCFKWDNTWSTRFHLSFDVRQGCCCRLTFRAFRLFNHVLFIYTWILYSFIRWRHFVNCPVISVRPWIIGGKNMRVRRLLIFESHFVHALRHVFQYRCQVMWYFRGSTKSDILSYLLCTLVCSSVH